MAQPDLTFEYNEAVVQGIDWQIIMTFYEADDVTPMNLAGALISLTVKPDYDSDDTDALAYIALDTADFTIDEDPDGPLTGVTNRISAVVPRATMQAVPVGTHPMDIDIIPAATGYLNTYGSGHLYVNPQVGRRTPA